MAPDFGTEPAFSLVIPCFNEERGLLELIQRCSILVDQGNGEVIFVDNGSTDNTAKLLEERLRGNQQLRWICLENNEGYGGGILAGLEVARSTILGWTHADLQTDPLDVLRVLRQLNVEDTFFAKGSRRGRPLDQRILTGGMSLVVTAILGRMVRDVNGQPTLFSRELYEEWSLPPRDFLIDLYAFAMAKQFKARILRFSVRFKLRKHGISSWNINLRAKREMIMRTILFSIDLRRRSKC